MSFPITAAIRAEIERTIKASEKDGGFLQVYPAARYIQSLHQLDNVALEDIVAALVKRAQHSTLGLELNSMEDATGAHIEVLIETPEAPDDTPAMNGNRHFAGVLQ